jgi:hypothetical protein
MKKTKYASYLLGNLPRGCKLCVKGEKSVIFVTGLCSRNCFYCPLSDLRKNKDVSYANERKFSDLSQLIKEVKLSNSKGCSLTGGDPLLKINKTLLLAKTLKKEFGKKFHIHIYLSTKLVNEDNLKELSRYIDEVRFHPNLQSSFDSEIKKISLAEKYWKLKNIGIELPMFPNQTKQIFNFIKKVAPYISFVNLNELEVGEFSEKAMIRKYKTNKDGYTVKSSIKDGEKLIKKIKREKIKLNVHLCTAELKNWHQYKNRLKKHKIFPFSKKTSDGTIIYFATPDEKIKQLLKSYDYLEDNIKKQIIINPKKLNKIKNKFLIKRIEEYPTYDREEVEVEEI